jgi:hypothetical protein
MLIIITFLMVIQILHQGVNKHPFLFYQIWFSECLSIALTRFKLILTELPKVLESELD